MLVDGIKETKVLVTGALTASQIIMYNFKKKSRKAESSYRWHLKVVETPLVRYQNFWYWLGVAYLRTLDIRKNLNNSQKSQ